MHHYYTAEWLHSLDDQTIDALVDAAERRPVTAVGDHPQADGRRRRRGYPPTPPRSGTGAPRTTSTSTRSGRPASPPEPHIAWARAARQAAQRDSAGGGYVNFIGADRAPSGSARRTAATTRGWHEIKAAYDPGQLLPPQQQHPAGGPGGKRGPRRRLTRASRVRSHVPAARGRRGRARSGRHAPVRIEARRCAAARGAAAATRSIAARSVRVTLTRARSASGATAAVAAAQARGAGAARQAAPAARLRPALPPDRSPARSAASSPAVRSSSRAPVGVAGRRRPGPGPSREATSPAAAGRQVQGPDVPARARRAGHAGNAGRGCRAAGHARLRPPAASPRRPGRASTHPAGGARRSRSTVMPRRSAISRARLRCSDARPASPALARKASAPARPPRLCAR